MCMVGACLFLAMAWITVGGGGTAEGSAPALGLLEYLILLVAAVELAIGHLGMGFFRSMAQRPAEEGRSAVEIEAGSRFLQRANFEAVAIFGFLLALFLNSLLWAIGGAAIAILSLALTMPNLESYKEIARLEAAGRDPWAKW